MSRWNRWRHPHGPSRRAVLGGGAALLTLPWLRSLGLPTASAEATPPVRLAWWFVPNGMHMPAWTPTTAGPDYELPMILQPLAVHRDDVTVITGLSCRGGYGDRPGDHARGTSAYLTCVEPSYDTVYASISADQVAAQALGDQTPFPSLQLGIDGGSAVGLCDSGYSCAYVRNISWAGPSTPLPKLVDPQTVFDRLFAGSDPSLTEAERLRRRTYRSSVLDHVTDDARRLSDVLAVSDRHRLDEYLTGVRELEQRIASGSIGQCTPPAAPPDSYDVEQHVDVMGQLMAHAFACDLTRLITFMMGNGTSNRSYDFLGVPDAHHQLSHHQGDPANHAKLTLINTWEVERFAAFLAALRGIPEGDGTLLDHTLVALSSDVSDGDRHNHDDLPVLLGGHGGGAVTAGRHLLLDEEVPIANLWISMLAAAGVQVPSFGEDGTGPLDGLVV